MKPFLAITLLTTLISPSAFALFCPGSFNQINFGDSIEQVLLQCGKPDTEKTTETDNNVPQEWSYYVKPNPAAEANFKMTIAFANNKVANITLNSQSLITTSVCGAAIQLGNTMEQVKAMCGDPEFINKSEQKAANANVTTTKTTVFTYKANPPVTLTFENGKLISRK